MNSGNWKEAAESFQKHNKQEGVVTGKEGEGGQSNSLIFMDGNQNKKKGKKNESNHKFRK